MVSIITKYELLKHKKLSFGEENIFSSNYKTIQIEYDKKNLFIQTPYILNRYRPSNYESKITLDIPIDNNEESNIFYKTIVKLHRYLKSQVIKENLNLKYSSNLKKKKIDDTFSCFFLKTKINYIDDKMYIKVFNSDKTLNKNNDLIPGKKIRFILHLENIWIYKKTYGFNWFIVQAEIKLPDMLDCYYFDYEDSSQNEEKIGVHPDYKKFFKMVSVGISKEAVSLKMNIEGLNGKIIFENPNISSNIILNKYKKGNITHNPPLFSHNLLTNVKLKKSIHNERYTESNNDLMVPTRNQLLEKINEIKNKNLKTKYEKVVSLKK